MNDRAIVRTASRNISIWLDQSPAAPQKIRAGRRATTHSDNGHDIDWHRAERFCGDRTGKWRLPTADELVSTYENTKQPARDAASRTRSHGLSS